MQIKISSDKLSVLKLSFNALEKEYFDSIELSSGTGGLVIEETHYTYDVNGEKSELFDFLNALSYRFDIELT